MFLQNLDICLPDHVVSYPKGVMFVFTSMTPSDLENQILLDSEFLYLNYENFMVTSHAVSVTSGRGYPNIGCSCYLIYQFLGHCWTFMLKT
jgi:hypothetical protein